MVLLLCGFIIQGQLATKAGQIRQLSTSRYLLSCAVKMTKAQSPKTLCASAGASQILHRTA